MIPTPARWLCTASAGTFRARVSGPSRLEKGQNNPLDCYFKQTHRLSAEPGSTPSPTPEPNLTCTSQGALPEKVITKATEPVPSATGGCVHQVQEVPRQVSAKMKIIVSKKTNNNRPKPRPNRRVDRKLFPLKASLRLVEQACFLAEICFWCGFCLLLPSSTIPRCPERSALGSALS